MWSQHPLSETQWHATIHYLNDICIDVFFFYSGRGFFFFWESFGTMHICFTFQCTDLCCFMMCLRDVLCWECAHCCLSIVHSNLVQAEISQQLLHGTSRLLQTFMGPTWWILLTSVMPIGFIHLEKPWGIKCLPRMKLPQDELEWLGWSHDFLFRKSRFSLIQWNISTSNSLIANTCSSSILVSLRLIVFLLPNTHLNTEVMVCSYFDDAPFKIKRITLFLVTMRSAGDLLMKHIVKWWRSKNFSTG